MRSSAARAVSGSSAATAATSSPTKRTRVSRMLMSGASLPHSGPGPEEGGKLPSNGVMTARTPGSRSASDPSTLTTSACGCGLRRIAPNSIPGSLRSAVYRASPVSFASRSRRTTLVPATLSVMSFPRVPRNSLPLRGRAGVGVETQGPSPLAYRLNSKPKPGWNVHFMCEAVRMIWTRDATAIK